VQRWSAGDIRHPSSLVAWHVQGRSKVVPILEKRAVRQRKLFLGIEWLPQCRWLICLLLPVIATTLILVSELTQRLFVCPGLVVL